MDTRDKRLWAAACILFVAGDTIITAFGIGLGFTEGNVVPRMVMEQIGVIPGLVVMKSVAMIAIFAVYLATPDDWHPEVIPAAAAGLGSIAIAWNLVVIAPTSILIWIGAYLILVAMFLLVIYAYGEREAERDHHV